MFSDPDPVEELMSLRIEEMSPQEIVTYIKTYQNAFGRRLAVEGMIERSVFKSMQRIYGKADANQIVKWAFYKYKGVWRGEAITFTSFAKGRKWWVDLLHQELQQHQAKESAKPVDRVAVGSVRLSDL